jgi:hypothetical protein
MAGVKDIETAIGKNDFFALVLPFFYDGLGEV